MGITINTLETVMSNDAENKENPFERLWKLSATIDKLVLDNRKDPCRIADHLQLVVADEDYHFCTDQFFEENFPKLYDLGTFEVPADYVQGRYLAHLKKQQKSHWVIGFGADFAEFWNPSRPLKAGERIHVDAHVVKKTSLRACMAFLRQTNSLLVGTPGIGMLMEHLGDKKLRLQHRRKMYSLDRLELLPSDFTRGPMIPRLDIGSEGGLDLLFDSERELKGYISEPLLLRFSVASPS